MSYYAFEGLIPVIYPDALVHPSTVLIGNVMTGAGVHIGPHVSLRGDYGRLILETGSNLQDGCITYDYCDADTIAHENGHIGHGATLHDYVVGRDALISMNGIIMDGTMIGEESTVAVMSFVKAGLQGEARQMLVDSPACVLREATDRELHWRRLSTKEYQDLVIRCRTGLHEILFLTQVQENRSRLKGTTDVESKSAQQLTPDALALIRPTRQSSFMPPSDKLVISDAYSWRTSSAASAYG